MKDWWMVFFLKKVFYSDFSPYEYTHKFKINNLSYHKNKEYLWSHLDCQEQDPSLKVEIEVILGTLF